MEITIPEQLAALSHPVRLDLFRLLIRHYPAAVPAGRIAEVLSIRANTASAYLTTLRQAGLIRQQRNGTSLLYTADIANIRTLFGGLMADCCQNRPDLCLPLFGAPASAPDPDAAKGVLNVLFLCTGNSARSILAEAILNKRGKGMFKGYSAGTRPKSAPHPTVLQVLNEKHHDTTGLASKSLDAFTSKPADAARSGVQMNIVITVCDAAASEECPVWPGHPISSHWGLPDPVDPNQSGPIKSGPDQNKQAVQAAYSILDRRISVLVDLPLNTMTPVDIQHALDDIGRMPLTPGAGAIK